jgi:L-aspartate oxidase
VLVLSPAPLGAAASSAWAQGGLAAALSAEDSPDLHAADTVAAGAGLVDPAVAHLIAADGPARVHDLLRIGVPFDRNTDGTLALSLEAAHSRPRVARVAGDLAGREIMRSLVEAARACPSIEVMEGAQALRLLQDGSGAVSGLLVRHGGQEHVLSAAETVLATGGIGGLYRVTTNPPEARGQGLGMALAAGALIADPEFVQFHPTAIDIGRDPAPLATEALRGEGATLIGRDGAPFMARHDPRGELAPRDVVARAIAAEIAAGRGAFLDCRSAIGAGFPDHFPTVFAACVAAGIDPRLQPIPVAPAAHYHMGGILTDLWGRTTLEGLSAVGECAATGAHGANRLASNSLLEAVVFADRIATRLREGASAARTAQPAPAPPELGAEGLQTLRAAMAADAGVARDRPGLMRLADTIAALEASYGPASEILAARALCQAALHREESRGGHARIDFPATKASAARSFLTLHDLG